MSRRTINPIKSGLLKKLQDSQETLGVKEITCDISPQGIVEAIQQEARRFPFLLLNYAGRIPTRLGDTLVTAPTFAIFAAHRDVSKAYVSGITIIDLIEDLVELIDHQRFAAEQKTFFEFAGDQLMFQDTTTVIYQVLFRTETVHQRRF